MNTWYLYDSNTHGEPGLYLVSEMSAEEIAEMNEPAIGQLGPDVIIEGTVSTVIEWLQRNSCTAIDTDTEELRLRCPEWTKE